MILSMWYWKNKYFFNLFFFPSNQLDSGKLAEMKYNKDLPSSYCLALAFLWTETSLHRETLTSTNIKQAPCTTRTIKFSVSKELPFATTIQITNSISKGRFKSDQGSSFQTPPILSSIPNKRVPVSGNVRTVQQNLLLLTRKQFHVIKTKTYALVQKQSDN